MNSMQNRQYITGLDGLRAFAILAVIAYHFGFSWAVGGFLGVDLFFVISGYLITSKILALLDSELDFSLGEFWIKRARRLLPAAYTMIASTFMYVSIFNRKMITTVLWDGLSSIIHASNWWFIFHEVSYFDSFGSPSPLKNLWSLAIEEQFYLVWPIVLIIGLKIFKKRTRFANIVFIGVLCSAILMGTLYSPGQDPSRVYYGTDTRAFELLIGSWMAIIYPMKKLSYQKFTIKKSKTLNITSMIALTIFILSIIFMNEYQPFLYRGGMLLLSLNASILTACICNPNSYLGRLLSWKPLSWVGKRSYGIYLWHYPIIVLSTPVYEIGHQPIWRICMQLVITLIIAELSYFFIETPIQKYGFRRFFRNCLLIGNFNAGKLSLSKMIVTVMIPLVFVVAIVGSTITAKDEQQEKKVETSQPEITIDITEQPSISKDIDTNKEKEASTQIPSKSYEEILAIGDSVMLDIAPSLYEIYPNITIDGKVGRQLYQAIELIPTYADFNNPNNAVIIELGSNAFFTNEQIDELLNSFEKAHIYLVNVRVPRQWEKQVNNALSKKANERNNVTLIDWYSASIDHPEYFVSDGVHLQPSGIEALTALIEHALNENANK
jgi:peptidoglycan/LPS O-acetylase OafA/YrhL